MSQAVLIRSVAGKDFVASDAVAAPAYSYQFGSDDASTRVAWSTSPVTIVYNAESPVVVTTQYGAATTVTPTDGVVSVALTEEPLYVTGLISGATIAP
jgi:hypothetical protein